MSRRRPDSTGRSWTPAGDSSQASSPPRLKAPGDEWSVWTPTSPASTATPAARSAQGHARTPSCAPTAASRTPTAMEHATSPPGPGWALVKPPRLEKLPASVGGAVTSGLLLVGAGGGQGGPEGGREQGRVGADPDEAPALGAGAAGDGAVAGEQAAGLAVAGGGGPDRLQRLQVGRRGDVAPDAEGVAEVAGADEQHVDAVDGGDGVGLGDGGGRLDLDHAQHLALAAVQPARVEAEAAGPVVGGAAAVAPRLVAQVPHGLGGLGGRAPPGEDRRGPRPDGAP